MKHNNWYWGIFFVLAAVFVIASQVTSFTFISFWTIAATVLLAAIFIQSLIKLNFFGTFLSVALAYMLYQHPLDLYVISPWLLILAAVLLSIGFHIIFSRRTKCQYENRQRCRNGHRHEDEYRTIEDVDGNNPRVKLSFGSSVKYIHAEALSGGQFACSLGTLSVYFDQAQLSPGGAEIYIDCSLAEIKLYFPKDWNVIDKLSASLGSVQNDMRPLSGDDSIPAVTLTGSVSLGSVEILSV